jgi:hypothetical protein
LLADQVRTPVSQTAAGCSESAGTYERAWTVPVTDFLLTRPVTLKKFGLREYGAHGSCHKQATIEMELAGRLSNPGFLAALRDLLR